MARLGSFLRGWGSQFDPRGCKHRWSLVIAVVFMSGVIGDSLPVRRLSAADDGSSKSDQQTAQPSLEGYAAVAGVLAARCLACHGTQEQAGGYSVVSFEKLLLPGDSGAPPVVPGHAGDSELIRRLVTHDPDERMPAEAERLPQSEIDTLSRWVTAGAAWPDNRRQTELAKLRVPRAGAFEGPEFYHRPLSVRGLQVSEDGQVIFVNGYAEVLEWSLAEPRLLRRLKVAGPHVAALSLHGQRLAVSSGLPGEFGCVEVFDVRGGSATSQVVLQSPDIPADVRFSPDGRHVAVATQAGQICLLEVPTAETSSTATSSTVTSSTEPSSTASSPDETWNFAEFTPHADTVLRLAWSKDGSRLLTAARDRTAKLFDMPSLDLIANYDRHERTVTAVEFVSQGPLTFDETGRLRLWAGDRSDRVQSERGNLPRRASDMLAVGNELLVLDGRQLRRVKIETHLVDDGQDDHGKSKQKKVVRITEMAPLILEATGNLTALITDGQRLVVGDELGHVYVGERTASDQDWEWPARFLARPVR